MRILKKIKPNIFLFLLFASLEILVPGGKTTADHSGPEKIVENKYTVILQMFDEGEEMRLRFFFRDMKTGKNMAVPIKFRLWIAEESSGNILLDGEKGEVANGILDFPYKFPNGGLYEISLEFEKADETGKAYRPDVWALWVPGQTKGFSQRYPIGYTEITGFLVFFGALGAVIFNLWWKHAKRKPLEISFFGIFGDEKSKNRRISNIKRRK